MKNILFTGGTGYIGGPILSNLIQRQDPDLNITVLVRSSIKVQQLRSLNLGVNVVAGSHEDAELVERLASEADVVFSLADCDDLPAAEAVLRGLEKRHQTTGTKSVLIHMSGTGCLGDNAKGLFASSTIFTDTDPAQIGSLPATQPHRNVDLAIVEADSRGYLDTYIVVPPGVYGTPQGILADKGIQNATNAAFDALIRASFKRGAAGIVGEGKNITGHVDVTELGDFVVLLYDTVVTNSAAVGHGRQGYFFADNGDIPFSEITKAIEAGVGPRRALTQEELEEALPGRPNVQRFFGDNSRSRAEKARALGWKPLKGAEDFLAALKNQVENWQS
ncbi:NAD(P)-binding protein [Roridomyces roridus]|uniref:NAD(P)-binding protein n=1 Tax=Roridomyces roridus TaxID=1738132 RepID=A0AAD7FGL0_9AGAR|nr:NAD(P)-binding protein [Roridomyces roridus]